MAVIVDERLVAERFARDAKAAGAVWTQAYVDADDALLGDDDRLRCTICNQKIPWVAEGSPCRSCHGTMRRWRREELEDVLSQLTHRERKVLELRFGLRGEEPRTLEEVGQRFGVTRERIRQIEAKTLNKLHAYRDTQRLREFLE